MKKFKVLTIHDLGNNYGSTLQACALCDYIAELGYDVGLIDYRPDYAYNRGKFAQLVKLLLFPKSVLCQHKRFEKYFNDHVKRTQRYTRFEELKLLEADAFLIGSDQLWNEFYPAGKDPAYYLKFTNCKNKFAYSASLGQLHTKEELLRIKDMTSDFKAIAVREKTSCEQLHDIGMKEVKHVLDPVFLYDADYYIDKDYKNKYGKYLLVYSVNNDELLDNVVREIAKHYNLKVVLVGGFLQKTYHDYYLRDIGPSEFVNLINNAEYVVANSFHATAMSIILNKQFSLVLSKNSPMRLTDMLEVAGISQNRIIKSMDEIKNSYEALDYEKINRNISLKISESKEFIKKMLSDID